jgi:large subunit ribosomal protein L35
MYRGKMKTKKAVKKRVRVTATGRLKHKKAGKGHLLAHKSAKRKRKLRRPGLISAADQQKLRGWLPYD